MNIRCNESVNGIVQSIEAKLSDNTNLKAYIDDKAFFPNLANLHI